jgi:hypothetical protein
MKHLVFTAIFLAHSIVCGMNLEWDRTEVNLEMAPDQEEIRATYTVTNRSDEAIRISRIKTSCGCTGSVVDQKILEPGDSTGITGTFSKGNRRGLNRNRLQVFIDGQMQPVATLLMNIQIPTLIEATPRVVYWNSKSSKTHRSVSVKLDEDFVNEIVQIDYDETKLSIVQKEAPDDPSSVILEITPKSYEESYRGAITIFGKGPGGQTADTRVHAFVQP